MRIQLSPCLRTLLLAVLLTSVTVPVQAQFGRVLRRAQEKVENKVEEKVDRAVDQAIECAFDDAACIESAKSDGKPVVMTDRSGKVITNADGAAVSDPSEARSMVEQPGTGVWRNYDFVPGDSVWYASDWSRERVGRFPANQLEFVNGNMEIVERDGRRLLETRTRGVFHVVLPADLPRQFTLELMLEVTNRYMGIESIRFRPDADNAASEQDYYIRLEQSSGIYRDNQALSASDVIPHEGNLVPIRLQVDDRYAILYMGSERVGQVPNADFPRSNIIEFKLEADDENPIYISDIVVRVGLDPLYDGLMASGEVTTHGFLFDVASDRLRPESSPKLEELRAMLDQHTDLKVMIEGHTDATGDDAANQDLSERRASAVVAWLTDNGIAANRVQASGKGESVPVGDNASEAGRQQNRRVVIRKI